VSLHISLRIAKYHWFLLVHQRILIVYCHKCCKDQYTAANWLGFSYFGHSIDYCLRPHIEIWSYAAITDIFLNATSVTDTGCLLPLYTWQAADRQRLSCELNSEHVLSILCLYIWCALEREDDQDCQLLRLQHCRHNWMLFPVHIRPSLSTLSQN